MELYGGSDGDHYHDGDGGSSSSDDRRKKRYHRHTPEQIQRLEE